MDFSINRLIDLRSVPFYNSDIFKLLELMYVITFWEQ